MIKIGLFGIGKLGKEVLRLAPSFSYQVVDLPMADILIDATFKDSVLQNIRYAMSQKKPIVVATTGWYDQLEEAQKLVESNGGFCLYSPNFSPLVQKMIQIAPQFKSEGLQISIEETHHVEKKDSPSGTALQLKEALGEVSISSIREGETIGKHKIVFKNGYEQITLEHEATDRGVFAQGILQILPMISGRKGFVHLRELLC
ncbi:MAG: 4-hydroxy-tetrahydrodipicolinate reductase [Chlamydiae bacterium]|nr:4-hydroxy-tetrahydrodipicolinate reductase [Chlamydiota bacterium]